MSKFNIVRVAKLTYNDIFKDCGTTSDEIMQDLELLNVFRMTLFVLGVCMATQAATKKLAPGQSRNAAVIGAKKWWVDELGKMPAALVSFFRKYED